MTNKQLLVTTIYLLIFGGFTFIVGTDIAKDKYNELETEYDILKTEYRWQLESCYQQLGDLQDRYEQIEG